MIGPLTVEENLQLAGGATRRRTRSEQSEARARVYRLFPPLQRLRDRPSALLSGGEQQMVAIGRALMTRPTLVLLDEPSMGLAPMIVQEIFEIIAQLNREQQVSFLIAEQNINVALTYASQGYVLDTGRVALSGSAAELLARGDLHDIYLGKQ